MKKIFFMAMLLMTITGWGALTASAQTWSWELSTAPISPNVLEITASAVNDEVYGIDEFGTPGILIPTYTIEGVMQSAGAVSPVVDLVVGPNGTVYVVSETTVSIWDPSIDDYTALELQPTIPVGEVGVDGVYSNIAIGMDGTLYVLYENTSGEQYLLKGNPPYVTEGVVIGFAPRSLNLSSKGNYVSINIALPSDFAEADIDPDSLMITAIEVEGVGSVEGLAILRAPDSPYGVNSGTLRVKFCRSTKKAPSEDQSITWQLEQLMAGQNKGKYNATLTLEASVNGDPTKFQGEASFTAMVTKKIK